VRIRFTRGWGPYPAGTVLDSYHTGSAEILIRRGLAVEAPPQPLQTPVAIQPNPPAPPRPQDLSVRGPVRRR
jgi:hypothetical protein